MMANHDQRFIKWIFDNVPADVLEFCHLHLIEDLVENIPNLRIMKQRVQNREVGYVVQYKNVVFTHYEKSNIDITKTAQEINKELSNRWGEYLGLKPFDILIQAHNHSSGKVRIGNRVVCQLPCMIDISAPAFDYVFDGKLKGNPPAIGYITMQEKDGKVLRESVEVHDIFD